MKKIVILFEQALRLGDNPALTHAAKEGEIIPVFIWDESAHPLGAASKWWLHHTIAALQQDFANHEVQLLLRRGNYAESVLQLAKESGAAAVYWNRCYEPANIEKYTHLKNQLGKNNIEAKSFNGSLLFEPWDITNKQGQYFKVFTPFWNHCRKVADIAAPLAVPRLHASSKHYESDKLESWGLLPHKPDWAGGLKEMWKPGEANALKQLHGFIDKRLAHYQKRDFPAEHATSHLSPYLHWGEISPRQVWHAVHEYQAAGGNSAAADKFLSELGWREFSYYLLYYFPTLPHEPYAPKFKKLGWVKNAKHLQAWQKGQTGYPIVDAGMRELWHTGYMHNRVRMVVASFLTKDLRISWQEGADWFLDTLVDADLANNSASWQWVAGSGADASPYYRIFNPVLQGEKFDAEGDYVKRWVPELANLPAQYIHKPWLAGEDVLHKAGVTLGKDYPEPIVDHDTARKAALSAYKALSSPS